MKQSPAPAAAASPNVLDICARFVQGHSFAKKHKCLQLPQGSVRGINRTFRTFSRFSPLNRISFVGLPSSTGSFVLHVDVLLKLFIYFGMSG